MEEENQAGKIRLTFWASEESRYKIKKAAQRLDLSMSQLIDTLCFNVDRLRVVDISGDPPKVAKSSK